MANPLTLLMPVIAGTNPADIAQALAKYKPELDAALQGIGTVHYARTLYLDTSAANLQPTATSKGPFVLGIITEYDGSFEDYLGDFVKQVGPIFDALLQFVVGGAEVTPVADNQTKFGEFITANDASQHEPNVGIFQAYPYTVDDILAAGITSNS